jgi:methyl-accepting chemotaxis protein
MKITIKLSILIIAILIIVTVSIAVILLRQAALISADLSERNLKYLAGQRAQYWKGMEEGYLQMLRGIANIMGQYESVPVQERRDRYDEMLRATLINNSNFVRIFSIWKPNALDGMDSQFVGRTGSTATGQYAMTWGRDTGQIVATPNLAIDEVTAYLSGPNGRKDRLENPTPFKVEGKDTFIVRMGVTIINPRTNEVVGNITCLIDIVQMQGVLENALASLEEIYAITIYTNDGTIMANFIPDRIGKKLIDADLQYGQYKVNDITKFTVILAVIAFLTAVLLVYYILKSTTNPIVSVANTLKDIAGGEGNLMGTIAVNSKDEVGDLVLYFNETLEKIKNMIILIRNEAEELSEMGGELAGNMTETEVNEITSNIQSINGRIINQNAGVTQTNATMETVAEQEDNIRNAVEEQGQGSRQILDGVSNVNEISGKNREAIDALIREVLRFKVA